MNKVGEDPYQGDEDKYQEHFRKTFITEKEKDTEEGQAWSCDVIGCRSLHDMMIPAGKTSKLVRVPDPNAEDFRISQVCDRLKFVQP